MIDLVLQAATEQAVALDLPQLAVQIVVLHARPGLTLHRHGDAGARQAALAARLRLAAQLDDLLGVHEHDGVLLPLLAVPVHIDDNKALGNAHLGRGDTAAVVLVHGVGHLLGEALEGLVGQIARLAHGGEQRIGGDDDGQHEGSFSRVWDPPRAAGWHEAAIN